MVDRVLDAPLSTDGKCLRLRGVTDGMRLNELEFYFPLRPLSPEKLKDLFVRSGKINMSPEFPERIGSLRFQPCRGFMKGYIDLVSAGTGVSISSTGNRTGWGDGSRTTAARPSTAP